MYINRECLQVCEFVGLNFNVPRLLGDSLLHFTKNWSDFLFVPQPLKFLNIWYVWEQMKECQV